jgi:hypothetical protein
MSTLQTTFIQKLGAGTDAFEIPANDGTNGQYLQTDGTGGLSWQTVAPALFESYAVIVDQKAQGTDGGSFVLGAWRTRDLNTELSDPDGIVTISSNQFTLAAGNYLIRWAAPAFAVGNHQTRLQDITNATTRGYGLSCYAAGGGAAVTHSFGSTRVLLSASTTYEIQHYSASTSTVNGFGVRVNVGVEQYTLVEIFREA